MSKTALKTLITAPAPVTVIQSNSKFTNGFLTRDRIADKDALKANLRPIAANAGSISYRDAACMLVHIKLHENDFRFHLLLTEISTEEDQADRGMLTSCIIQHHGNEPGNGFFDLAKKRRRIFTTQTKTAFWISEHERVFHANRKFLDLPPKSYR